MLKELKGKSCKLQVEINGSNLFFSVRQVTNVTDTHISFLDKYNKYYIYRLKDIKEVNDIE